MTEKDEGGSAFPTTFQQSRGGMSLRDYFAAAALQGMLAHSRGDPPHGYRPRKEHQYWHAGIVEEAYEIADMMLEARDK